VTHDGSAVLVAAPAGDVYRVLSIRAHGEAPAQPILPITGYVGNLESGPDGAFYVEQDSQTYHIFQMGTQGGALRQIRSVKGFPSLDNTLNNMVLFGSLPDGRGIISEILAGRQRLVAAEEGKDSVPLISTSEENTGPVTLIGNAELAFQIGPVSQRSIAIATISNGRVTRRIPFDHGIVSSLAASSDGTKLYAAAGGMVWTIPVSGGAPAKLHAGDAVALEPGGQSLLIQMIQPGGTKLVRVALNTGAEQEIALNGPWPISNYPISTGAIRDDGRLAVVLAPRESWFFDAGIVDLKTGRLSRIPLDYLGDCRFVTWLPDGQILASMAEIRSSIWKFTPEKR
jgi:hypothetical protein